MNLPPICLHFTLGQEGQNMNRRHTTYDGAHTFYRENNWWGKWWVLTCLSWSFKQNGWRRIPAEIIAAIMVLNIVCATAHISSILTRHWVPLHLMLIPIAFLQIKNKENSQQEDHTVCSNHTANGRQERALPEFSILTSPSCFSSGHPAHYVHLRDAM